MKTQTQYKYEVRHPSRTLSIILGSPDLKPRIRRLAHMEGRSISNWVTQHWIPLIEDEVNRQESRLRLPPLEKDPTVPPVRDARRKKTL